MFRPFEVLGLRSVKIFQVITLGLLLITLITMRQVYFVY